MTIALAIKSSETPILRLHREWEAVNAAAREYVVDANLNLDAQDELMNGLFYDRAEAIAEELMSLPCTCAADFAAKLIVSTIKGSCMQEWKAGQIWAEARHLTNTSL